MKPGVRRTGRSACSPRPSDLITPSLLGQLYVLRGGRGARLGQRQCVVLLRRKVSEQRLAGADGGRDRARLRAVEVALPARAALKGGLADEEVGAVSEQLEIGGRA